MTDAFLDEWTEIARYARRSEAEGGALALSAIGIGCRLVPQERGTALFVGAADAARARRVLAEYERENRRLPPKAAPPAALRPFSDGLNAALACGAILVFLHVASLRQAFGLDWWSAGYAQAGLIVGGEWWRALTSLGLHADFGHLGSNIAAGSLFGLLLARSLGSGLAWLAILTAAGVGNAVNALFQPAAHTAVGASTAVFAALGLLSAFTWRRQAATPFARGLRRWLPLAAGATLLAYLGLAGERTDVGAHVAGFAAGVAFGVVLYLVGPRLPQGRAAQYAFGTAALAMFALAWLVAFRPL